jgi:hypothetical protein
MKTRLPKTGMPQMAGIGVELLGAVACEGARKISIYNSERTTSVDFMQQSYYT